MTDNFVSIYDNQTWILGDNSTTPGNAVKNVSLLTKTLTIPSVVEGNQIEEIGYRAFYRCFIVEEVFISNSIRRINQYAFSDLYNLKSIIIPPSIEFIGYAAINTFNRTQANEDEENGIYEESKYMSNGYLVVTFLPHSMIQYISQYGISRKRNIIVNYFDSRSFYCHENIFMQQYNPNVKIYAPYTSSFCGYKTIYQRTCQIKTRTFYPPNILFLFFLCK